MNLKDWIDASEYRTDVRFAKRARVSTSTLSRFLRGESSLSAENMKRIVAATRGEITLDDLIQQGSRVIRAKRARRRREESEGDGAGA